MWRGATSHIIRGVSLIAFNNGRAYVSKSCSDASQMVNGAHPFSHSHVESCFSLFCTRACVDTLHADEGIGEGLTE